MITRIDTRVRVGGVFREEGGKIEPRWFLWKGKRIPVKEITYTWQERTGRDIILKFAVTDGSDIYQLSYWQERLIWFLDAVEIDG